MNGSFRLQATKESLHACVVPNVSLSTHTAFDAVQIQHFRNRDRARKGKLPEPSMLQIVKIVD
jgi:hypothetical protein